MTAPEALDLVAVVDGLPAYQKAISLCTELNLERGARIIVGFPLDLPSSVARSHDSGCLSGALISGKPKLTTAVLFMPSHVKLALPRHSGLGGARFVRPMNCGVNEPPPALSTASPCQLTLTDPARLFVVPMQLMLLCNRWAQRLQLHSPRHRE